jgi:hypothetical protein
MPTSRTSTAAGSTRSKSNTVSPVVPEVGMYPILPRKDAARGGSDERSLDG